MTGRAAPSASALAAARARRRLSVEEAAARAGLGADAVRALEQGRLYRFASVGDALAAALVYATALGIDAREARALAGLPVRPRPLQLSALRRLAAAAAFALACLALAWFVVLPRPDAGASPATPPPAAAPTTPVPAPEAALPETWQVRVDVLNGSTRPGAAASLSNRIAALAYRIGAVDDARRSDYPLTRVYFSPGADAIAGRLADSLGVGTAPLQGDGDPLRLVVIVGREDRRPPGAGAVG